MHQNATREGQEERFVNRSLSLAIGCALCLYREEMQKLRKSRSFIMPFAAEQQQPTRLQRPEENLMHTVAEGM